MTWIEAFVLTELIEIPIYLLAQRGSGRKAAAALAIAAAASLWTHPAVWFVFPPLPRAWGCHASIRCWEQSTAISEVFALLVEAWWLRSRGIAHPLAWSLVANGASFGFGLWLSLVWWG